MPSLYFQTTSVRRDSRCRSLDIGEAAQTARHSGCMASQAPTPSAKPLMAFASYGLVGQPANSTCNAIMSASSARNKPDSTLLCKKPSSVVNWASN
jgi:hypothetical protein